MAELNYEIEAQNLEVFKAFHEKLDAQIIIPNVFKAYSSRRVLTLSLEQGESIETASTWPIETRNQIGHRLIQALGQEMFFLNRFHCDPHPGNFAFRSDGSVIIYDFGSVKTLSFELTHNFKALVNAARQQNIDQIEELLIQLHSITEKNKFPQELYEQWIEILLRPLTTHYDFAQNSSHHDGMRLMKKSLKYWDIFKPSPDTLMINRTISGQYWNLIHLKVHDNFNQLFEEFVPPN